MPVINRIRIVNVSYDHNYIRDEVFDLKNGVNTLFNLSNGGGKSVMVQMIFQPIIPKMSIGNYKISDYLSKNNSPTYIMIEWLLDNTNVPMCFLTGICMRSMRGGLDSTSENSYVDYFTFTHEYQNACDYDIINVPIFVQNKLASYRESFQKLRAYSYKNPNFAVYRSDKRKEYELAMSQHGIYVSEWKRLERINQREGGLGVLFEQYKTSESLFNKEILRAVSDTMEDLRIPLNDLLTQFAMENLKQNENIRKRDRYAEFIQRFDRFTTVFKDYSDKLDQKETLERYLKGILKHVKKDISAKQNELSNAQNDQAHWYNSLERVRKERLSEEYYISFDELSRAEQCLFAERAKLPVYEDELTRLKHEYMCMEAAQHYANMVKYSNELNAYRKTMENLYQSNEQQRLNALGYSIHHKYLEVINDVNTQLQSLQEQENSFSDELRQHQQEVTSYSHDRDELVKRQTVLKNTHEYFLQSEKLLTKSIGMAFQRCLTGELDIDSVETIQQALECSKREYLSLGENLLADRTRITMKCENLEREETQLHQKLDSQRILVADINERLKQCQDAIKRQKGILSKYEISERYVFENDVNANIIQEKISGLRNDIENNRRKATLLHERLDNFNKNQLHVSRKFAEILQQNGIFFQTGEEYLSHQSEEFRKKLLDANPILPYSFIIDDIKDLEKVLDFESNTTINRVCPVVYRGDIETPTCKNGEFKVAELEKYRFYGLYDYQSIDPKVRPTYVEYLTNEINTLKNSRLTLEERLQECLNDLESVRHFEYNAESLEILEQKLKQENDVLTDVRSQLELCKNSQSQSQAMLIELSEKIAQNHTDLSVAEKKLADFNEYLTLSKEDVANLLELGRVNDSLEKVEKTLQNLKDTNDQLSKSLMRLHQEYAESKASIKVYYEKASHYAQFIETPIIDDPLEQLEMEYSLLQGNIKDRKSEYEIRCTQLARAVSDEQNTLQTNYPKLTSDDYNIPFDRDKLSELKEKFEQSRFNLQRQKNDISALENDVSACKNRLESRKVALSRNGLDAPLEKSEILQNYDEREKDSQSKLTMARQSERTLTKEIKSLEGDERSLYRVLNIEISNLDDVKEITETVNLEDLSSQYHAVDVELKKVHKKVLDAFNGLENLYRDDTECTIIGILDTIEIDSIETYLGCCRTYEQLDRIRQGLSAQMFALDNILKNFDANQKHVAHQVYSHALQLYCNVMWIADNSYVRFNGKNLCKTLDFDIPKELDSNAQERIELMVNNAFANLRNSDRDDTIEYLKEKFSDRAIFNALTNTSSVSIRVYKVRQDNANTLEKWESVYSGGERFLTYFIVYSSLAEFARHYVKRHDSNSTQNRTVFLIDNPFGATSSPHLLDALINITSHFQMQLVCFSDLKQSSITNSFDLIYQLSLKHATYGEKSYLTVDSINGDSASVVNHELEHVSLEQLELDT